MKKMIYFVCATILGTGLSYGQSNNPKNKLGADIVAAAAVLSKDYKDGKLKDLTQATIDRYYEQLLPGYEKVRLEDVTKIISAFNGATSQSVIKNSGLSAQAQAFLQKSLTDYSQTALAEDVKKSSLPESEKNIVLMVIALNYNLIPKPDGAVKAGSPGGKGPNADFDIDFDDAQLNAGPQVAVWGVLGAVTGFYLCGPWCAVAGGLIGLIIGSLPGTHTVTGPGGSHTYTSGGPQP